MRRPCRSNMHATVATAMAIPSWGDMTSSVRGCRLLNLADGGSKTGADLGPQIRDVFDHRCERPHRGERDQSHQQRVLDEVRTLIVRKKSLDAAHYFASSESAAGPFAMPANHSHVTD